MYRRFFSPIGTTTSAEVFIFFSIFRKIKVFFREPIDDLATCLERQFVATDKPAKAIVPTNVGLVVYWCINVPIHELLYVAGCVLTGGTVTTLELDPKYDAALLARIFPFVVAGSEYAGRLAGFDTKGSDLI